MTVARGFCGRGIFAIAQQHLVIQSTHYISSLNVTVEPEKWLQPFFQGPLGGFGGLFFPFVLNDFFFASSWAENIQKQAAKMEGG